MEEEKGPRKKKRGRRVLIVLGVLVVVGLILHWPTENRFTISRETTYVTGPLNPDGTINYVAALNGMMSKGVTPENNAAPLLIRAFGPALFPEWARQQQLELLGIEHLPRDGHYFVKLDDYLATAAQQSRTALALQDPDVLDDSVRDKQLELLGIEQLPQGRDSFASLDDHLAPATPQSRAAAALEDMDWQKRQDMLDTLCKTPWSAADHPAIAAWLKANEKPLSLIIEASKRPRYYLPQVSESSNPRTVEIFTVFLPYLDLAEALSARAMLKLDGGDIDGATADLLAAHRLARLLAQPPLLLDKLIALAVDAQATEGTIALANSGRLAGDQARRMLLELDALGPMPDVIDAFDHGERLFMLDFVMQLYAGDTVDGTVSGRLASQKYFGTAIDWDRMLRNFNRWYDRIVAAVREPDRRKRQEAVNGLISELRQMKPGGPAAIIKLILGRLGGRASKAVMTDALSNIFIRLLTPVFSHLPDSRYRAVVRYDLARVTLALAAFKAEKDEYPAKLAALVPGYIKAVPRDVFSDKPVIYKRDGKGYLLYSVGVNMKDDGGVEDEATDEGDITVRVK